jgi:hypothetical protein
MSRQKASDKASEFAFNAHQHQTYGDDSYFNGHLVPVVRQIAEFLDVVGCPVYKHTDELCESLLAAF